MKPKWQKLASLAQKICTLWFQFFGAVFASKGNPFKNIFNKTKSDILKNCWGYLFPNACFLGIFTLSYIDF